MTHHLDMFMSGKNVGLNGLMFCGNIFQDSLMNRKFKRTAFI